MGASAADYCPEGMDLKAWAALIECDPGGAVAAWMESNLGLEPETEGPNRGPWLRRFLFGGDGLAYCVDAPLSCLKAIGGPMPLPPPRWRRVTSASRYWYNRAARSVEKGHKRGGTWMGPGCPPRRGDWVFHRNRDGSDSGPGGHMDVCIDYDPGTRVIKMVGANLSDRFVLRVFELGHKSITGFGVVAPPVRGRA